MVSLSQPSLVPYPPRVTDVTPWHGRRQVSEDNKIMGVVTEGNLMSQMLNGRAQPEDVVTTAMYRQFKKVRARC